MANAREIVWKLLQRWTVPTDPPLLPERGATGAKGSESEAWEGLSSRDRAFAFDLITGTIRWRGCLDAVIASRLRQGIETLDLPVRTLLWVGAYQLLFQGGTTDYAAVDTAVELARSQRSTEKAAGLVNAVLRGITRLKPRTIVAASAANKTAAPITGLAGAVTSSERRLSRRRIAIDFASELEFAEDIFPDPARDLSAHLASARSHPRVFVDHLRKLYGDPRAADLLLRNNLRPTITLRCDRDALDVPAAAGLVTHADTPRFLVAAAGWNDALERLVVKGELSPQDPTSAKPVRRIAELVAAGKIPAPVRILDLCAGMGTKTLQLARAFPKAHVIAADIDEDKLARLAARAKQARQENIAIAALSSLAAATPAEKAFDLVLADVPCSNTGVMARRVQSRWRWPALDRAALKTLQMKILADARAHLPPGGTLIYATCSIDPVENEALVREAGNLNLVEEALTLPSLAGDSTATHDGGYYAILTVK